MLSSSLPHNLRIAKAGTNRKTKHALGGDSSQSTIAPRSSKGVTALHSQATDARMGRIVRLLTENATVVVSGTKIAEEISL